jgi:hypothetical protein
MAHITPPLVQCCISPFLAPTFSPRCQGVLSPPCIRRGGYLICSRNLGGYCNTQNVYRNTILDFLILCALFAS